MAIVCQLLKDLYLTKKYSSREIARQFNCSENQVNYWLKKFKIPKRSVSEALYLFRNPTGDPFKIKSINSLEQAFLFGLGIGLYWGEGTKSNQYSVRLGNSDPGLVRSFIQFLEQICGVEKMKLKFGLQIFNDLTAKECLKFWQKELRVKTSQFYSPIISPSQSRGTYRRKAKYGVVTLYFNNKKLRDIMVGEIEKLRQV